jgi:hypothetical protein
MTSPYLDPAGLRALSLAGWPEWSEDSDALIAAVLATNERER